jgi:hypothetical protein
MRLLWIGKNGSSSFAKRKPPCGPNRSCSVLPRRPPRRHSGQLQCHRHRLRRRSRRHRLRRRRPHRRCSRRIRPRPRCRGLGSRNGTPTWAGDSPMLTALNAAGWNLPRWTWLHLRWGGIAYDLLPTIYYLRSISYDLSPTIYCLRSLHLLTTILRARSIHHRHRCPRQLHHYRHHQP